MEQRYLLHFSGLYAWFTSEQELRDFIDSGINKKDIVEILYIESATDLTEQIKEEI